MTAPHSNSGYQDALAAAANGTPKLFWQTRGRWGEFLTQLMAERYGVEVVHVSDLTTQQQMIYEREFNHVTRKFIDDNFGEGTFSSVLKELRDFRLRQYREHLEGKSAPNDSSV